MPAAYDPVVTSVEVTDTARKPLRMPAVCAKTGEPTADIIMLSGSAAPGWTGAMIVFGFLPWLFVRVMSGQPYRVALPLRSEVVRRHRDLSRASVAVFGLGVLLAFAAVAMGRERAWLLLGLCLLGIASSLVNEWTNGIGVRLAPSGALVATRVHPRFRDAVLAGASGSLSSPQPGRP